MILRWCYQVADVSRGRPRGVTDRVASVVCPLLSQEFLRRPQSTEVDAVSRNRLAALRRSRNAIWYENLVFYAILLRPCLRVRLANRAFISDNV